MTTPRREDLPSLASEHRRASWSRVRNVFEAALTHPAERRSSFVATLCRNEPAIEEEVLALLAAHAQAGGFLETPAVRLFEDVPRADLDGRRIGPYQFESRIGRGGMGGVYRARDTRLGRTVAVKVLPSHAAASRSSRDRFEREARTIAALNHPHICALYRRRQRGRRRFPGDGARGEEHFRRAIALDPITRRRTTGTRSTLRAPFRSGD